LLISLRKCRIKVAPNNSRLNYSVLPHAKIFEVRYGKGETVISITRTTGSHKAVSIVEPGEAAVPGVYDVFVAR
jgi:hypothetical protein